MLTEGSSLKGPLLVPGQSAKGDILDALTVALILAEDQDDNQQHV